MPTVAIQYRVQDGQPVLLDVLIGDSQPGGSSLFLGEAMRLQQDGDIVDHALGTGEQLRGKALVVSTVVFDRNANTDFGSTVVILDGGTHPHVDVPQSENMGPGGSASFITVVRFV
ncbi:MAG: hypothetical protein ACRENP_14815 [Longimicrobiales bacterium]